MALELVPLQINKFRLVRPQRPDFEFLHQMLDGDVKDSAPTG